MLINLLAMLQELDASDIFRILTRESPLIGVNASMNIVYIRIFFKISFDSDSFVTIATTTTVTTMTMFLFLLNLGLLDFHRKILG